MKFEEESLINGKLFFNRLEENTGIRFGVADRLLIRKFLKEGFESFENYKYLDYHLFTLRTSLGYLKALGYESQELYDEIKRDGEYLKGCLGEWEVRGGYKKWYEVYR